MTDGSAGVEAVSDNRDLVELSLDDALRVADQQIARWSEALEKLAQFDHGEEK